MIAFHGTSLADAAKIMRHGFDLARAGSRQKALRGESVAEVKGVYLTNEHLARHFYATSDLKRPGLMDGAVIKVNVSGKLMPTSEWWTLRKSISDAMGLRLYDPRRSEAIKKAVEQVKSMGYAGLWENDEEFVVLDAKNVKPLSAYKVHDKKPLDAHEAIAAVLDGVSPTRAINEKINPKWRERAKHLKPNDKMIVYHGTSKVYVPGMINGFDAATQEVHRLYGGPRHVGLFVTLDPDVAARFAYYGEVVFELEVRAKNLHGTDYSGNILTRGQGRELQSLYPDSFRPGLSFTLLQKVEPQALLLGMVRPRQIKRIRWSEGFQGPYKWYTRKELLSKGIVVHGEPGSGYGEHPLEDWGIDLSSTRTTVPEFLDAVKRIHGGARDIDAVFRAYAAHGTDKLYDKLRYIFKFGAAAARALAKKLVDYYSSPQEDTTTAAIATYPLPMGMVKKTRKKKQGKDVYEDLLHQAAQWLLERKKAPTLIMYHGTSTKFLREILKKGLVPNPRMRVWSDDESARRHASQETRRSLDSVYFASNFMSAVSAGGNAHRKFGGTYLFVAAQIQPRAAFADEDTIKINWEKAVAEVFSYRFTEDPSVEWFELVGKDLWTKKGREVAEELAKILTASSLPFGLGKAGARVPPDVEGCTDALRGFVEQAATVRYAQEGGDAWLRSHLWRTGWPDAGWDASEDERQAALDRLKKNLPTMIAAENLYLKGMDSLTRRYKGLAMLGQDAPNQLPNWFTHTLRVPTVVDYSGSNRILAVFQTRKVGDTNYITVHYGKVTPRMISDMQRSSWMSGDTTKIVTPAEAKKLGITEGE